MLFFLFELILLYSLQTSQTSDFLQGKTSFVNFSNNFQQASDGVFDDDNGPTPYVKWNEFDFRNAFGFVV